MADLPNLLSGAYKACLFDMDGVITDTATVHAAAWKQTFDELLMSRSKSGAYVPFDIGTDYIHYVDGRPRDAGVREFLASRGIVLPNGLPTDPPGETTVWGVGNRKNELVLEKIRTDGVKLYDGTRQLILRVREAGLRTAVVSASANTKAVLESVDMHHLFDTRIDGITVLERGLPGKPAPDTFLEAAKELGCVPEECVVFEDALAGVAAGHAGHFGLVVGVDRHKQANALVKNGADVVVDDPGDLLLALQA
jgi:beta-phosphoglucomutase family hydrolase